MAVGDGSNTAEVTVSPMLATEKDNSQRPHHTDRDVCATGESFIAVYVQCGYNKPR
jgi:hypothetical protein